ncbi:MAG: NAD-dependent protein deacetylase sirtuin-2 [Paramarteilia canceri]
MAGLPSSKLVQAHGNFSNSHCINCSALYDLKWLYSKMKTQNVPKCDKCLDTVKPDVVLFGEALPDNFAQNLYNDFSKCDLLIICGTSLAVKPFSLLVNQVGKTVPRFMINSTIPPKPSMLNYIGLDHNFGSRSEDKILLTETDEAAFQLSVALNMKENLEKAIADEIIINFDEL